MFVLKRYQDCVMHSEVAGRMLGVDLARMQGGQEVGADAHSQVCPQSQA